MTVRISGRSGHMNQLLVGTIRPALERKTTEPRKYGTKKLIEYLIVSVCKIQKKLGSQLHKEVEAKVLKTFEEGNPELHKEWIKILLERYYDPMYIHQLSQKKDRVIFTGTFSEVRDWLKTFYKT